MAIKKELASLRISKLERGPDNLVFTFMPDTPVKPELLTAYLQTKKNAPRLTPDGKLVVRIAAETMEVIRSAITGTVAELSRLTAQ